MNVLNLLDWYCQAWVNCRTLEASVPAFRGLCKSFENHSSLWKHYFSVSIEDVYFIHFMLMF